MEDYVKRIPKVTSDEEIERKIELSRRFFHAEMVYRILIYVDDYHFFFTCKYMLVFFRPWIFSKFGPRQQILVNFSNKFPKFFTINRVELLISIGVSIPRSFAQTFSVLNHVFIDREVMKNIIARYKGDLYTGLPSDKRFGKLKEKHSLEPHDTVLWRYFTEKHKPTDITIAENNFGLFRDLIEKYHFYPQYNETNIQNLAFVIMKRSQRFIDLCKDFFVEKFFRDGILECMLVAVNKGDFDVKKVADAISHLNIRCINITLMVQIVKKFGNDAFSGFLKSLDGLHLCFSSDELSYQLICEDNLLGHHAIANILKSRVDSLKCLLTGSPPRPCKNVRFNFGSYD